MKPLALALALAAFALLVSGAVIGYGVDVYGPTGTACGTALHERSDLGGVELGSTLRGGSGESGCDQARAEARPLPVLLLLFGATTGLGAAIAGVAASPRSTPADRGSAPQSA